MVRCFVAIARTVVKRLELAQDVGTVRRHN
jgi:hypothetical protein